MVLLPWRIIDLRINVGLSNSERNDFKMPVEKGIRPTWNRLDCNNSKVSYWLCQLTSTLFSINIVFYFYLTFNKYCLKLYLSWCFENVVSSLQILEGKVVVEISISFDNAWGVVNVVRFLVDWAYYHRPVSPQQRIEVHFDLLRTFILIVSELWACSFDCWYHWILNEIGYLRPVNRIDPCWFQFLRYGCFSFHLSPFEQKL